MKATDSASQISLIRRAIRQTNFSDSITHGPRMKAGCFPPSVTFPILSGFDFMGAMEKIVDGERQVKHREEEQR